MYFLPKLYTHNDENSGHLFTLSAEFTNAFSEKKVLAIPVKKVIPGIYIQDGREFYSWIGCFEEI